MPGKVPSPGLQVADFTLCPVPLCKAEEVRKLSRVAFVRALIPSLRAPPLRPNYLAKAPPPITITAGIDFNLNFEVTNVQSIAKI